MNLPEFQPVGKSNAKSVSILNVNKNQKIDRNSLREDIGDVVGDQFLKLDDNEAILSYLKAEQDTEKWKIFCKKYKMKVSPEFQKVLIELEIKKGKDSSKLLPLATYYNAQIKSSELKDMICLDLSNETFIQYFIPPKQSIRDSIKTGFRVYHLIGHTYGEDEKTLSTSELIETPIAALHFNTLTQNLLKISENSQSSLLQKVARVFIEN